MLNIVLPISGKSKFFPADEYLFPRPLIEINGKTMIEHVINNLKTISQESQFIFIINAEDAQKYHLDNILSLLTDHTAKIVILDSQTKGAACSILMAVDYIDNSDPLLIVNSDQIIATNFDACLAEFAKYDGGSLFFESIHPRWSYIKLDDQNLIIQAAEKHPISNHAIAGLYYFTQGKDFIESAKRMIKKDANVNGSFFIAPTFNEMILMNKKLKAIEVDKQAYHSFYSPQKIQEFEREYSNK